MMQRSLIATAFILLVTVSGLFAQGTQTGTISGTIQSGDGLTLPGVTVTAMSSSLQGERSAISDVNGVYIIRGLPAGVYTVRFNVQNFQSAAQEGVELQVGGVAEVNTTMQLATRTEVVTVTASSPTPLATVTA